MATSNLIFIIGRQRSGTTVFRNLLARNGALDCDEIFHGEENPDYPQRFYGYVWERAIAEPRYVYPLRQRGLFYEYINKLHSLSGGRKLAMDVKYFGLNLIPQHEDMVGNSPFILDYIREKNAHVAHIIRRNKLRVYVSEKMSSATGKWSVEKAEHMLTEKPKLQIDVKQALQFIDRLNRQDDRVKTMLDTIPMVARLYYDEMFTEDGLFSEHVQDVAARFMDRDAVDPKPGNLKMNPEDLAELVGNYDELAQALQGTRHEWMLTGKD